MHTTMVSDCNYSC